MLRLIKAIEEKKTSIEDDTLDYIRDRLLDNIAMFEEKASHRIAYAVTAALLFSLLEQSVAKSFSFLGITIEELPKLAAFVTPICLYFALSCVVTQTSRRQSEEIAETIIKRQTPDLWTQDLEEFLIPHPLIRTIGLLGNELTGYKQRLARLCAGSLGIVTLTAAPGFYIYSTYILLNQLTVRSTLFWISFAVSTVLLAQYLLIVWLFYSISNAAEQPS